MSRGEFSRRAPSGPRRVDDSISGTTGFATLGDRVARGRITCRCTVND